ncbi:unnamed protein product, partial [Rotaria sp. Silwood1]
MGSDNSTLTETNFSLRFSGLIKHFYRTNEIVSGMIECYYNGASEVKLKYVSVELVDELVYPTHESLNPQKSSSIYHIPFFFKKQILWSADDQNELILTSGTHIWPFSLHLDDSLPPTLKQGNHQGPCIRYYFCAQLRQSGWHMMYIEKQHFIVIQRSMTSVHETHLEDQDENRKGVRLHAFLHKNIAVA